VRPAIKLANPEYMNVRKWISNWWWFFLYQ